ncbi:Galactose oxidase central domain protein [Theileria parva strain Muguga]|uniref:Galactose oxidase central domain protein n=1 Tax=Theileria parva strain Muguga TaxID=333668 RepID=UPI001C61C473|nr:Galactose oxidase central domain protein [Theileria parva strain Muguga]KAF5153334.1 Galactose oxidase central domain protein [Theileria parva strain Muguga]
MIKFTHLIILLLLAHCVKLVTSNVKWTRLKSGQFRNKILKFAATSGNNSQYMFGGEIDGRYTNNLFVLNDPNLEWSILSANGSFPSRRSGSTLTKIGSSLYVIGGHNDNGTLNTIYRFDTLTLNWSEVIPLNDVEFVTRSGHSATTDGKNRIYVFGGYNDDGYFLNDLYKIDLSIKYDSDYKTYKTYAEFTLLSDEKSILNPSPRESSSLIYADSKLYLFGGYSYTAACTDGLWIFDLSTNRWYKSKSHVLPPPGEGYTGIRMGRAILYFGGCNYTYNAHRCYNNVWNYDTIGDKWTIVPSSFEKPLERGHSFLFYSQNSIILYGGSKLDNVIYNDMWKLSMLLPCTDPKYSCFGNGECSGSSCTCFTGFLGHDCGTEQVEEKITSPDQEELAKEPEICDAKQSETSSRVVRVFRFLKSHVKRYNYVTILVVVGVVLALAALRAHMKRD